jgi:hypothetical protein
MLDLIFCMGGNKDLGALAKDAGWKYGVRSDYTSYFPSDFIDYPFERGLGYWDKHLAKISVMRPEMAAVPDLESPDQIDLMLWQCEQLRTLGVRPMVIPKYATALLAAPKDVIIGISVPSQYSGYLPDPDHLKRRDTHLLGAGVVKQIPLYQGYAASAIRVVSADSNQHQMKAFKYGACFVEGRWQDVRPRVSSEELFARSCANIKTYWSQVYTSVGSRYHQMPLIGLAA